MDGTEGTREAPSESWNEIGDGGGEGAWGVGDMGDVKCSNVVEEYSPLLSGG